MTITCLQGVLPSDVPTLGQRLLKKDGSGATLEFNSDGRAYTVIITNDPFKLDFFATGVLVASINGRGLLNLEERRTKIEDESWEEDWKTHKDTQPHGPASVAVDVSFHGAEHVYGIPEHATSLSLGATKGNSDPYRLCVDRLSISAFLP